MNQFNTITASALAQREQSRSTAPAVPEWLKAATLTLRTKFAAPKDGRGEWTPDDTAAYGRVLSRLGPERCAAVIQLCRERYTWRPTVAEVVAIVDELVGRGPDALSAADARAQRLVTKPLALPPHPDNDGRLYAKAKVLKLRGYLVNGPWQTNSQREAAESEIGGRKL